MKLGCPNCGSNVYYKVGTNVVYCPHCAQESRITFLNNRLLRYLDSNKEDDVETSKYTCSSCGAKFFSMDKNVIKRCNFCGSNNLLVTDYEITEKYTKIIPFLYTKESFLEEFRKFISNNPISNVKFFKEENIETITGIYVPVSCNTYNLDFSSIGTLTRTSNVVSTTDYQFKASYEVDISFDRLKNLPDFTLNNLMPFYFDMAKPFSPYYLCGFACTQPDDYEDGKLCSASPYILEALKTSISNKFDNKTHYNAISNKLDFTTNKVNEYLVPVWICSYSFNGEIYSFAMNGQTGTIISTLPVDKGKLRKIKQARTNKSLKTLISSFSEYLRLYLGSSSLFGQALFLSLIIVCYILILYFGDFFKLKAVRTTNITHLFLGAFAILIPVLIVYLAKLLYGISTGIEGTKKFYSALNDSLSNINYDKNHNFVIKKIETFSASTGNFNAQHLPKKDSIFINNRQIK